jgi:putative acetyltransferase
MITIKRTTSTDEDFHFLVSALDAELKIRDGDEHAFYSRFNQINQIKYVVIAYSRDEPVGCGAVKEYSPDTMEIKRMFVRIAYRGMGIASLVLNELEVWSAEMSYKMCILETGLKQPEAINLYKKNHYRIIPNYGQYQHAENSVCFRKELEPGTA